MSYRIMTSSISVSANRDVKTLRHTVKLCGLVLLAGCATSLDDLRLVSKPGMQFSETRAFASTLRAASQIEPGRVLTAGPQASVCTSCR